MEFKKLQDLAQKGVVITEAKSEYDDSSEFTNELATMLMNIHKVRRIINSKRWKDWMKISDEQFPKSGKAVQLNNILIKKT